MNTAEPQVCVKCGREGLHYVRYRGTIGGTSEWLEVACTECGYMRMEPTADAGETAEPAKAPEPSDAQKVAAFQLWFRGNPSDAMRWLQKEVRLRGGRFW